MTNIPAPPCFPDHEPLCPIVYEPCGGFFICEPQPVPTMSEWSLIGLTVLILIAVYFWRRHCAPK